MDAKGAPKRVVLSRRYLLCVSHYDNVSECLRPSESYTWVAAFAG
jgi:hypothetical protein